MKTIAIFFVCAMAVFAKPTETIAKNVIVGFLPQDVKTRVNKTNTDMASYFSGYAVVITRYGDYPLYDTKAQKVGHIKLFREEMQSKISKIYGRTLSDSEIVQKILSAKDAPVTGLVSANGISIDQKTGSIIGVANAVTRKPYAEEHKAIIEGPLGILEISRQCFNFFPIIPATGGNFEEPQPEKVVKTTAEAGVVNNFYCDCSGKDGQNGNNGVIPQVLPGVFIPQQQIIYVPQTTFIPQQGFMNQGMVYGPTRGQMIVDGIGVGLNGAANVVRAFLPNGLPVQNGYGTNSNNNYVNVSVPQPTRPTYQVNNQACSTGKVLINGRCMTIGGGGVQNPVATTTLGGGGVQNPFFPQNGGGGTQNPFFPQNGGGVQNP